MKRVKGEYILLSFAMLMSACQPQAAKTDPLPETVTIRPTADSAKTDQDISQLTSSSDINTADHSPGEIVDYARTLQGIPYLFASTDPERGFDCSGFITYVFNHFNIKVPRSSIEFTNEGTEVDIKDAEPGDLILFTGTDSSLRKVGHMGLIENRRNDSLFFIHSSSGKANGVVITPFERYYQGRFIKVIRIFPDQYFDQ